MALTNNQMNLIKAVQENNLYQARKVAMACLVEDTTQKNQWFTNKYKNLLQSAGMLMELPSNIKSFVQAEDLTDTFKENRYYLSVREQEVFDNIIRMRKVSERLLEMGISYHNSTLLYGESGTGKTTFGQYVAYKTGLPFVYLKFSDLMDSYMGNTSKNIGLVFSYASSIPCVLMLDEVDCISITRANAGSGGSGGEMARITISLMQEFDKLNNNMIIIGATNRYDRIDAALLRRFSLKHEVKVLDSMEKETMISNFLKDVNMTFPNEEIVEMLHASENQAVLLNDLIRRIANKIETEVA